MDATSYKSAKFFTSKLGVSDGSLRRWELDGKIDAIRSPGGFRLYSVDSVNRAFGLVGAGLQKKVRIAYARVSSAKQKPDLERQIEDLRKLCPDHEIVSDVGSGLGFKRPGLRSILDRVHDGVVEEVAVLHKDRLCRFAFELLEYIFGKAGVKLVVLGDGDQPDKFSDLGEDLLAVTTYFVAQHNGRRSAKNKRDRARRERYQRLTKRKRADSSAEDPDPPDSSAARDAGPMVRGGALHVQPGGCAIEGAAGLGRAPGQVAA